MAVPRRYFDRARSLIELSAPFCVASISVLYFYTESRAPLYSGWRELRGVLVVAWVIAGVITAVSLLAWRRNRRGAVSVATLACMAILLYPPAFILIAAVLGVMFLGSWALALTKRPVAISFQELSAWALLCILALYGAKALRELRLSAPLAELTLPPAAVPIGQPSPMQPDIYYIIVDGHGASDVLGDLYDVDSSAFLAGLKSRGFVVAPQSRSNYMATLLSLSSSLNMNYLTPITSQMGDSQALWPLHEDLIESNQVVDVLRAMGYRIVVTTDVSDFSSVGSADRYIRPYPFTLSDFGQAWLTNTAFSMLPPSFTSHIVPTMSFQSKRETPLSILRQVPQLAEDPGPNFFLVHIVLPHPPFVLAADGAPVTPPFRYTAVDGGGFPGTREQYVSGYAAQVQFLDSQLLSLVDGILANSAAPPIIIIQGDHGPGSRLDSHSAERSCLWERFSILNAYYLPGVSPADVPPDITPVNTFRLIFDRYFGADLPLLPNRQYFTGNPSLFDFVDVTDKVGTSCPAD